MNKTLTRNCHSELVSESQKHGLLSFADRLAQKFEILKLIQNDKFLARLVKQVQGDKKRVAFTLAELLITLTIIGVIAAITIPNLYSKYQKHVWVTQLRKAYTRANMAQNLIQREFDDEYFDTRYWSNDKTADFLNLFAEGSGGTFCKLRYNANIKDQGEYYTQNANCKYAKYPKLNILKGLNGRVVDAGKPHIRPEYLFSNGFLFTYPDGQAMSVAPAASPGSGGDSYRAAYFVMVDVNGSKGPNVLGRDVFDLAKYVGTPGIVPFRNNNVNSCGANSYGKTCAKKIIEDGWKMDY